MLPDGFTFPDLKEKIIPPLSLSLSLFILFFPHLHTFLLKPFSRMKDQLPGTLLNPPFSTT